MKLKKRLLQSLLLLSLILFLPCMSIKTWAKEEGKHQVEVTLNEASWQDSSGANRLLPDIKLINEDGETIESLRNEQSSNEITYIYEVEKGTYQYIVTGDSGLTLGEGSLKIEDDTAKVYLHSMDFESIIYSLDRGKMSVSVTHQDGMVYTPGNVSEYFFYVPAYDGESYYNYSLIPNDTEKYVTQRGHVYVYAGSDEVFKSMNLSDGHLYSLLERHEFVAKVPKGVEIYHIDQSRFYMARDYYPLEKLAKRSAQDPEYDYYQANYEGKMLLRQTGKVTRYCDFWEYNRGKGNFGSWNEDKTEFTFRVLTENEKQVTREKNSYFEANVATSKDSSRSMDLEQGTYYDLVAMRAWQAISNSGGNKHFDPDFHYTVLGDAVTVGQTDDDLVWQFGRIQAKKTGTSVVLYTYDAMEWLAEDDKARDENGFVCYSAMWPENTGVQIVQVGQPESGIDDHIDLDDFDTIYWLESQTNADGTTVQVDDHGEYTFTPTSSYQEDTLKVRVHDPYQIENGGLNISDEENWQDDSHYWTHYQADSDGNFTIKLKEGRNIVEISSEHGKEYRVITAKPVKLTVANKTREGKALAAGDTALLHFDGFCSVVYKLGAIYNPTYDIPTWDLDGTAFSLDTKQWAISKTSDKEMYFAEAGTYSFENGKIRAAAYTAEPEEFGLAYRQMTRCGKLSSAYRGQDSGIKGADRCILPDFTLEVEDFSDLEEANNRKAGELESLKIGLTQKPDVTNATITAASWNGKITAKAVDSNAEIFARYWKDGESKPEFVKIANGSESVLSDAKIALGTTGNVILYFEVLVKPQNGYPMLYSRQMTGPGLGIQMCANIMNMSVSSATDGVELGRFGGIVECADEENMGYGFALGESHFKTSVPHEVEQIKLNLFSAGNNLITLNEYNVGKVRGYKIERKKIEADGTETEYKVNDTISLQEGKNEFRIHVTKYVVAGKNSGTKEYEYYLTIVRRPAARTISFQIPDGASLFVTNEKEAEQKPQTDGSYQFKNGTYFWHVSKDGYLTKSGSLTVTDDTESQTITVDDLEPVPEQNGSVSVKIAGQNTVLRPAGEIEIPKEIKDLKAYRYVKYNYGGYTVLHALLDACEENGISFKCSKGKLTPENSSADGVTGLKAGWICEVNGVVCSNPANVLANDGDKIEFYYHAGLDGMLHAVLTPENTEVARAQKLQLTVTGRPVNSGITQYTPVEGAEIYEGNTLLGTTDAYGQAEIDTRTLLLGTYYLTAVKKDTSGNNILTAVMSTVTVKKANDTSVDPNTTVVTFRLIGDTRHGEETDSHAYTTWIATDTYTFNRTDVTVGDVFEAALGEAGLTYVGKENNYVSSITAPESCGGFALAEKENGPNSGWMYTVNGKHPDVGLNDCYVTTGDEIIWHYIDDYKTEQADMMGDMGPGGDPSTWNKWLEALDETPGARDAAAEVVGKINAIGTVELTDECEAAITDARTAYDGLTREQKKYVDNYTTLTAAEEELAARKKAAEDQAAADEVIRMITELPSVDDLTMDDQSKVEAARTAYGNLTEEQKKLVDADNDGTTMDALTKAEERIAKLLEEEAADQVADEIDNLPSVDDLTIEDKSAVESAKAHYDALNDDQKDRVEEQNPGSAEKLEKLVERMEELKAAAADQEVADKVSEKLNALPAAEDVMLASEDEIKAARDAFDALTEAQQGKVSEEAKAKLTDAEAKLSELQNQLKNAADLIGALPNTSEITLAHEDQIKAARDAYDALNNEQKNKLTEDGTLSKLLEAENQLTYVKNNAEAAKKAEDRINSLPNPGDLKMSDKSRVEAARDAYDALTDEQKDLIPKDTYDKLKDCEAEMKNLVDAPVITLKDKKTGVSVTGKLSGYELVVTPLQKTDDAVIRMKELLGTKETLTCLYDVKLYLNGQEVQPRDTITLNFKVGSKYNNKTLRIFHDHNGLIEELEESVKAGVLSLDVDSLSPFGIVVKKSTTTNNSGSGSHSGSHSSSGSDSSSAASTAASTAGITAQGTPADTSTVSRTGGAKTGDDTDFFFPIVGMLTATGALAGILFIYKKNKTEEES